MARKAGEALRGFKDYLADYDLKARGAGSDKKKGPVSRFSALDVNHVFDNRGEGVSKSDGAKAVLSYYDDIKDKTKSGGGTQRALDRLRGFVKEGEPETPPTTTPETDAVKPGANSGDATAGDNSIASPISQQNPISIDGDSNQVNQDNSIQQTQNYDYSVDNTKTLNDNSVRNYGADGGGGKYGGADDSPAAAARFMDMYIDSNRLNQRSMRNDFEFYGNNDYSANDRFGAQKREKGLNKSIKETRGRSDKMQQDLFGGSNPFGFTYTNPEKPDPIESDAKNIYENALKKIK
jgi:hypothetical protein